MSLDDEVVVVLPRSIGPIEDPNENDVLGGRGGDVNSWKGNLQMRGFCVDVLNEYKHAKKTEKKGIAYRVVKRIRALDPPGRFLKKDNGDECWWEIGDEGATKKVAGALRESVPDKQEWEQYRGGGQSMPTLMNYVPQVGGSGYQYGAAQNFGGPPPLEETGLSLLALSSQQHSTRSSANKQEQFETQNLGGGNAESLVLNATSSFGLDNGEQKEENFFSSIFGDDLVNEPRFTEEQLQRERSELTEEEQRAIVSDLFGEACEIAHRNKKVAREPASSVTIPSLLRDMRAEIDAIPLEKKNALVEARKLCCPSEFSDDRMELFLQREDMNAKLAADRFVSYWMRRRELFGADKFHLPITLSGALRDDKVALEAGVYSIVPEHDASGRPILFYAPYRHTRDGYSRDSLLRAIWYVFEAIMEDENARKDGVVVLSSWKQMTLWEYDRLLEKGFFDLESLFLPLKFCAIHASGVHPICLALMKPITFAFLSREKRLRIMDTALVGNALLESLESYGISKHVVPTDMDGNCHFSHSEWLQKRRSAGK